MRLRKGIGNQEPPNRGGQGARLKDKASTGLQDLGAGRGGGWAKKKKIGGHNPFFFWRAPPPKASQRQKARRLPSLEETPSAHGCSTLTLAGMEWTTLLSVEGLEEGPPHFFCLRSVSLEGLE